MEEEIKGNKVLKEILEWSFCVILAVVIALITRYYLVTSSIVQQDSMYPTLKENERVLLSRIARTIKGEYKRGDIVTFEAPSEIKKGVNVDKENPRAIYNYNPKSLIEKLMYNVLEFRKVSYIKRVIGLPGERVTIYNGKVYINGKELIEDYLDENVTTKMVNYNDVVVPEGYVFLMGDNRDESMDSRTFGCVPIEKIEGKVKFRYWPLNKFGGV